MSKTELGCNPQKKVKVLDFEVDFLQTEVFQIEQNGSHATKYRVFLLLWCEKSQSSWRSFHVSLPKFDLLLLYLMERRAPATYNILQTNWVVCGWFFFFLINGRKNCHFWSCSVSHSFLRIWDIYLENSLLNFYFGFYIKKRYPFIFLHT